MNIKKLKIAFDCDDVICEFSSVLNDKVNQKFGKNYSYEDIRWGFDQYTPEELAYAQSLFTSSDFILALQAKSEAIELINNLVKRGHDVFFVTNTCIGAMDGRAKFLVENFPALRTNIIITPRKDLVNADVLIDDCVENLRGTPAEYKVCRSRPWNMDNNEFLRVDSLLPGADEIIKAAEQGVSPHELYLAQNPAIQANSSIIVLVGASGSGKTTLAEELVANYNCKKVITTTTRAPRPGEVDGIHYRFTSKAMFNPEDYLEWTEYSREYYGTPKSVIDEMISNGENGVIVMDINGAQALKKEYPNNVLDIYIERPKHEIITSILERDVSIEEKAARIENLDNDYTSKWACRYAITHGSVAERTSAIAKIANL